MSETDPDSWRDHEERSTRFALRLIRWIALHLGRPVARAFLPPITLYYLIKARREHAHSRNFYQRVTGRKGSFWQVARHYFCFAATILDRVYFLTDREELFDIQVDGEEHLAAARQQQRGVVLLGSHLGSFDALRGLSQRQQLPLKVLMYRQHNAVITGLLAALNPKLGEAIIELGRPDCLIRAHNWLQQDGCVAMLADRAHDGDRSTICEFLGRPTHFPLAPFLFALTTDAPTLMVCALYTGSNRYQIHIEPLAIPTGDRSNRDDRNQQASLLAQQYADRLAYHARHAPDNWFNFYDYWRKSAAKLAD